MIETVNLLMFESIGHVPDGAHTITAGLRKINGRESKIVIKI